MAAKRKLMLLGTMSNVGKSTIAAGLCRYFSNVGCQTVPFKALNISAKAAVLPDGGKIGIGQAVQASAARAVAEGRMNPILIQLENGGVQYYLRGQPSPLRSGSGSTGGVRKEALAAFRELEAVYDAVVLEGSGSCCELNMFEKDTANGWMAAVTETNAVLVADVERGGVFAQVCGTLALLPQEYRKRIRGIIINKFHGEPELFRSSVRILEERTGVPVVGVLPWKEPGLPEEDGTEAKTVRADTLSSPKLQARYDALAEWLHAYLDMEAVFKISETLGRL